MENETQAKEALFAAMQADGKVPSGPPSTADAPAPENKPSEPIAPAAEAAEPAATEQPPSADSFTGVNPADLPPELQGIYKSMQADYTRKQQELAQQRQSFGDIDPEEAQEALTFYQNLRSDPQYALQVHEYLTEALTDAGLTPAQAEAEASRQIVEQPSAQPVAEFDSDPDAYLKSEVDELKQWKQQFETERAASIARAREEQYIEQLASTIQRQDMALREAHGYNDEQMDRVYELAVAHDGNLEKGHDSFQALKAQIIGQYVDAKGSVPLGDPVASAPAQAPREFRTASGEPDIEAAHRAAMTMLQHHLANQ